MFKGNTSVQENKKVISIFSANSRQGCGQPTPPIHSVNMDTWYEPSSPCEGVQVSNRDKRRIAIPGYENELLSVGGPAI